MTEPMAHSAENGAPPCEVHVPGRDAPSPWCAACRMSGASAENDACGCYTPQEHERLGHDAENDAPFRRCEGTCDYCRPDAWHECTLPAGHDSYHSCTGYAGGSDV